MILLIAFLSGLFFGSFGNVISLRLHSHKGGIIDGHSECPKCGHLLSWYENIPLFSWLFLRGKCRSCYAPISWQYPAAELFFGFLFATTTFFTGLENPLLLAFHLILVFALGVLFLSDARYQELPDEASFPAIALAFVAAVFSLDISLSSALLGAVVTYGFFALQILLPTTLAAIRRKKFSLFVDGFLGVFLFPVWLLFALFGAGKFFEKIFEKEETNEIPTWVGGGDLRLAILIGLTLGPVLGLGALFLGYMIGTLVVIPLLLFGQRRRKDMIALGPFLISGMLIFLWAGDVILEKYFHLLGF